MFFFFLFHRPGARWFPGHRILCHEHLALGASESGRGELLIEFYMILQRHETHVG
jgi:hypothetical protein